MTDFAASLGRMLIFSTVLPGVIGCAAIMVLFPQIPISNLSTLQLSLLTFGIGFLANAIGHFVEILVSRVFRKWPKTPYSELIGILPKIDAQLSGTLTHDIDYLECLHVWYWNSGTVLLPVGLTRLGVSVAQQMHRQPALDWLLIGLCLAVSPILFYLSYATQSSTTAWVLRLKRQVATRNQRTAQQTVGGGSDTPGEDGCGSRLPQP